MLDGLSGILKIIEYRRQILDWIIQNGFEAMWLVFYLKTI